jgi:hypothetical protein
MAKCILRKKYLLLIRKKKTFLPTTYNASVVAVNVPVVQDFGKMEDKISSIWHKK